MSSSPSSKQTKHWVCQHNSGPARKANTAISPKFIGMLHLAQDVGIVRPGFTAPGNQRISNYAQISSNCISKKLHITWLYIEKKFLGFCQILKYCELLKYQNLPQVVHTLVEGQNFMKKSTMGGGGQTKKVSYGEVWMLSRTTHF